MALDTAIYPASQDSFGYICKELYGLCAAGANNGFMNNYGFDNFQLQEEKGIIGNWELSSSSSVMQQNVKDQWDPNSSPEACTGDVPAPPPQDAVPAKRKRRRTRTCKNKEELENQRMTHIAVERNRRKQMNDYLAVIRSLMPSSYVQRGDQASIIGGAINFVKELEQHLQTLEATNQIRGSIENQPLENNESSGPPTSPVLFGDFFTFPQYSTRSSSNASELENSGQHRLAALAEIEVTMAESHANMKILSKKRPRQLLKLVAGLQCLWLTILHLNVTTVDQMVLYSLSVKLEEGCQLTTVDEIADAVNLLLGRIQEEAASS